jgi:quercetin dioxygenase-like cupin family protein
MIDTKKSTGGAVSQVQLAGAQIAERSAGYCTPRISKAAADIRPRELVTITVRYAPGGCDPSYWHAARGLIYVLEGSIVIQVKGGKEMTLASGESFYERPDDVHVVRRNASSTMPAKFVGVFFDDNRGRIMERQEQDGSSTRSE